MGYLLAALESVGVFILGLLTRFALLLLVVAVLAIPVFLGLMGVRGYGVLRRRALGLARVDGLFWRPGLHYAPGHTWVKREGIRALKVGLDDLAQRLLLGARSVELPRIGTVIRAGEVATVVTCGDKHAGIASPVDGTVTGVNEALGRNPSLIHRDPYARGWLFAVAPANSRYASLPRGEPARGWLREEGARLAQFLERDLGVAAADGGEFLFPAPSLLTEAQWRALTRAFLKTG